MSTHNIFLSRKKKNINVIKKKNVFSRVVYLFYNINKQILFFFIYLKALGKNVADNILITLLFFIKKIRLVISFELSARQTIHKKCQAIVSLKNTNNQKQELRRTA